MFRSPIFDAVVIIVVLLLFAGPKRLPMLSRSIGESIKEFKGGVESDSSETDKAEITAATAAPVAAPQATATSEQQARIAQLERELAAARETAASEQQS